MPRERPPCFDTIWRDCSTQDGYFGFSDGTFYRYPAGAEVARNCANRLLRGVTFNKPANRRPKLGFAAYEKIDAIPETAVLLYPGDAPSFPPGWPPCPEGSDWSNLNGQDFDFSDESGFISTSSSASALLVAATGVSEATDTDYFSFLAGEVHTLPGATVHWSISGHLDGDSPTLYFCLGNSFSDCDVLSQAPLTPFLFVGAGDFEAHGDFVIPDSPVMILSINVTPGGGHFPIGTATAEWTVLLSIEDPA